MNFLKRLLGRPDAPATVKDFWKWFLLHERNFHAAVSRRDSREIDSRFLEKLVPCLQALNEHFYCETGMLEDTIAELVITAEGDIKSFIFVEELVAAAPTLPHWKFTPLKPPTGVGSSIKMNGTRFGSDTIRFFYEEDPDYPDEINLTMVHEDYGDDNKQTITHGCLLYLDALLGELNVATLVDNLDVKGPAESANMQLIPMEKLNDFLLWKEKEFVEKYEGTRHNTENDEYVALEREDQEGLASISVMNSDLLKWDAKASHPWMTVISIDYTKTKGMIANGMPGEEQYDAFNKLQEDLNPQLIDSAGYLNLGRETYKGESRIFYACRDFRTVSKVIDRTIRSHQAKLACSYDIYKDKYWRTMNPFQAAL
jgi:hypothetical protein